MAIYFLSCVQLDKNKPSLLPSNASSGSSNSAIDGGKKTYSSIKNGKYLKIKNLPTNLPYQMDDFGFNVSHNPERKESSNALSVTFHSMKGLCLEQLPDAIFFFFWGEIYLRPVILQPDGAFILSLNQGNFHLGQENFLNSLDQVDLIAEFQPDQSLKIQLVSSKFQQQSIVQDFYLDLKEFPRNLMGVRPEGDTELCR